MICQICRTDLVESNQQVYFEEGMFRQKYFCFACGCFFECSSQSGDMVEENLLLVGEICDF